MGIRAISYCIALAVILSVIIFLSSEPVVKAKWITVDAEVLTVEHTTRIERRGAIPFDRYVTIEGYVIVASYEYNGESLLFYSDMLRIDPTKFVPETVKVSFDPNNTERYSVDTNRLR